MHYCQGKVEKVKFNHLDNNKNDLVNVKKCCSSETKKKHCELPKEETKHKDDCCKDVSSSDIVKDRHTVNILKLIPVQFLVSHILQIATVIENIEENKNNFLTFYVASNAPPNYIINSQLTFYEG